MTTVNAIIIIVMAMLMFVFVCIQCDILSVVPCTVLLYLGTHNDNEHFSSALVFVVFIFWFLLILFLCVEQIMAAAVTVIDSMAFFSSCKNIESTQSQQRNLFFKIQQTQTQRSRSSETAKIDKKLAFYRLLSIESSECLGIAPEKEEVILTVWTVVLSLHFDYKYTSTMCQWPTNEPNKNETEKEML